MSVMIKFTNNSARCKQFAEFIRQKTIMHLRQLLTRKKVFLDSLLKQFNLTSLMVLQRLNQLVHVTIVPTGFMLYLSDSVIIDNQNILSIIKAIDFGSSKTGLPKNLFFNSLMEIKNNIQVLYQEYLGVFTI